MAAQSCLTGLDTFYWHRTAAEEWQAPMPKWTFAVPTTLGQFPAAALLFRKGYVRQGPAVVHEERSLADVWSRKLPMIAEEGTGDPNRDKVEVPAGTPIDPLAFLVGRVEVQYGGDPSHSKLADLSRYIDAKKQVVRSVTGEITTDLAQGLYLVDAPRVQAAAGFLGRAGAQRLADVTIALRQRVCRGRRRAARRQPHRHFRPAARPGRHRLPPHRLEGAAAPRRDEGRPCGGIADHRGREGPWQIEKTQAAVTVRNASLRRAVALDANGMAGRRTDPGPGGGHGQTHPATRCPLRLPSGG